jgi:hypothetical protein
MTPEARRIDKEFQRIQSGEVNWAGFWSKQLLMYDLDVLTSEKLYGERKH